MASHNHTVILMRLLFFALITTPVMAKNIDCNQKQSGTEIIICSTPQLLKSDENLSAVYEQLLQQPKPEKFRSLQKEWIKNRNRCKEDVDCLVNRYAEQNNVMQQQLRASRGYQPDAIDLLAISDLKALVQAQAKVDAEFALNNTLQSLKIKTGITSFNNVRDQTQDIDFIGFPKNRPKGVSNKEWEALLASQIEGGGENGVASYSLIDLDGDGLRDLLVNSYIGGTGLFSYVSILRQDNGQFTGGYVSSSSFLDNMAPYVYFINGRGANQASTIINLRDRIYFAYRNSYYGEDTIYLLRALTTAGNVPILKISYHYRFSVPKVQKKEARKPLILSAQLHTALTRSLEKIGNSHDASSAEKPLCPIPISEAESNVTNYYGYGPGHYSHEIIDNIAVHLASQCYVAQVIDWFGSYGKKHGLVAQISMKKPAKEDEQSYQVTARRRITGIETSQAIFIANEPM
jgi:uncharacterized protein